MQIEMDTQLSGVFGEDSVTDSACSITPAKPISLKLEQEIVFDMPRGNYLLQAIATSHARVGFEAGVNVSGEYALFRLSQ